MKKFLPFILIIVIILLIGGVLIFQSSKKGAPKEETSAPKDNMPADSSPEKNIKKIAMVIAWKNFRDAEYFVTKENLASAEFEITTASTRLGEAVGAEGGQVQVDILESDLNPGDFDAVVFIGGPAALSYLDNQTSYNLAQQTLAQGKVLAAICIAPSILAKAGVLQGKKATVWTSSLDKSAVKTLEQNGAVYEPKSVVVDGSVITADGPASAEQFAEAIINALPR